MDNPVDHRLRNWESARVFLEVARNGSFRSASQSLSLSVNTLRRQIEDFEREIGLTLFTRHVDGVRLTAEGLALVGAVKRMEVASLDIARLRNLDGSMQGEVRLSVTEGLGTFWLAPRLVEFQCAHPSLLIDMRCTMHPADVLRLETDVGIQITRPTAKDLRIVKLGRLHAMLFASQEYLDANGSPASLEDLRKHGKRGLADRVAVECGACMLLEIEDNPGAWSQWINFPDGDMLLWDYQGKAALGYSATMRRSWDYYGWKGVALIVHPNGTVSE